METDCIIGYSVGALLSIPMFIAARIMYLDRRDEKRDILKDTTKGCDCKYCKQQYEKLSRRDCYVPLFWWRDEYVKGPCRYFPTKLFPK